MATHNKPHSNKTHNDLSAKFVQSVFSYHWRTGKLYWMKNHAHNKYAKREAGFIRTNGYRYVHILGKDYLVHRIIFLWMTGKWPPNKIDHKISKVDNRWRSIRPATNTQNSCNKGKQCNNTSGYKGVTWRKNRKHWIAQIVINKTFHYLGAFKTKKAAHSAYCAAAKTLHKDFANFG